MKRGLMKNTFALGAACAALVTMSTAAHAASFFGTEAANTLVGTKYADLMDGRGGNDRLIGREGNDGMRGGAGNDRLYGHAGSDRLFGGEGNDGLWLGAGTDSASGDAGNDRIYSMVLDGVVDEIRCGEGNDLVVATAEDRVAPDCETVRRIDGEREPEAGEPTPPPPGTESGAEPPPDTQAPAAEPTV